MLRWIDGTRETIAAVTVTNDLNAEGWLLIAEGRRRLEVDGIPS